MDNPEGRRIPISATLTNETVTALDKLVESKKYRNRSHAIEVAVLKLVECEVNGQS